MSEISKLIAEIKSEGILRAGNKLEQLYSLAIGLESDYAALQQKLDAMAAELNNVREQAENVYAAGYQHGHLNTVDGIAYATPVEDEFYHNALQVMLEVETPATDAYLNSARAEALREVINSGEFSNWVNQGLQGWINRFLSGTHDTADEAG